MGLFEYKILGARCICVDSKEEYVNHIENLMHEKKGGYSVAINAEKIMLYQKNKEVKDIIDNSILPSPDGVGALIGLKLLHKKTSLKIDLPKTILEIADKNNSNLFVLGASSEVNMLAIETIRNRYPSIKVVGNRDGYFKDKTQIIEEITQANPQIIMMALGTPKQEVLAVKVNKLLPAAIIIGCGGALDVLAGKAKRAPKLIQNIHIEWLWRLIESPSRIKRQKVLPLFLFKVILATLKK